MSETAHWFYPADADEPDLEQGYFTRPIGDFEMFYRVNGAGPVLVVQNGLWVRSFTEWHLDHGVEPGVSLPEFLAKDFTVIEVDGRGTGRSTLGRGPATYGRYAVDTVRLLDSLGIERAHFFGHSDGACVGLHLLLDHPERIARATLAGAAYNHEGYDPETAEWFRSWYQDMEDGRPAVDSLADVPELTSENPFAREPERFAEYVYQMRAAWSTEPNFNRQQLSRIRNAVLVISAGADPYIPVATFQDLAGAVPRASIVSFPALGHEFVNDAERKQVALAVRAFCLAP